MIIAFEGVDRCGKTEISRELACLTNTPVFKNTGEWSTDLKDATYFKNLLVYGGTFLIDFLCQVRPDVIFDRYYPSEWVYSRFFKRDTNEEILRKIDQKFSEIGGKIILCRRKSYRGIFDDMHEYLDSQALEGLDKIYEDFVNWTTCEVYTLWVDDENLEKQIAEIKSWLSMEENA